MKPHAAMVAAMQAKPHADLKIVQIDTAAPQPYVYA